MVLAVWSELTMLNGHVRERGFLNIHALDATQLNLKAASSQIRGGSVRTNAGNAGNNMNGFDSEPGYRSFAECWCVASRGTT